MPTVSAFNQGIKMSEFTMDEKTVFAELMGMSLTGNYFSKTDVIGIIHTGIFNPLNQFTEILKGLTRLQSYKVNDWILNEIPNLNRLQNHLWIESHKPEILQAILNILESKTDKTGIQIETP